MELTPLTVGAVVSTTNASLSDNELPPPIVGNVNVAAFPAASFIVPLLRARDEVLTYSKSELFSPAPTV